MKKRSHNLVCLLLLVVILVGCSDKQSVSFHDEGLASFNIDSLTQRIITLSSDGFQGRRPFTEGETKTVEYLSKSFASLGLEPGNNGSYFQEVPMVEITPACDPTMKVSSSKGSFNLKYMDDYVIWTESTAPEISLTNDEVVFAGFGVVAPEYNWNDYAGIDVKGKVVLVMVNDPGFGMGDTTLFKGNAMTYYGRWTYKFEEASRQGAKGCLIIHNTEAASYPFAVVQNSWANSQLHLNPAGQKAYRVPLEGWLSGAAAKRLLMQAKGDTSMLLAANGRGFRAIPLDVKLTTSMKVKAVMNNSKNVVAKLTGTKKPEEYIVFTAHWDHFGIGKPDESGDSIYNGALDNASGTAALLEMAKAYKSMATRADRTLVFLAVTGEEQGLLGSAHYAQNPVYPSEQTVANINVDGINNFGKTKDFLIIGPGQSELEDLLKVEVEADGRYIAKETMPEAGLYFRSDHFSFAKIGIPALTTGSGIDHVEKGKEYGTRNEEEYNEKYYHRPGDEYDPARWNLEGGMEDVKLLFQLGKVLAYSTRWPGWKENSEFKALRKTH